MESSNYSSRILSKTALFVLALGMISILRPVEGFSVTKRASFELQNNDIDQISSIKQDQQIYPPLNDQELEFIKNLRAISNALVQYSKYNKQQDLSDSLMALLKGKQHRRRFVEENNKPDAGILFNPHLIGNNNNRRLERSLNTGPQFPVQQQESAKQLQIYQDEQAFKRQLPDLIAQAHNDKILEQALLRMLINTSLSVSLGPSSSSSSSTTSTSSNVNMENNDNKLDASVEPFAINNIVRSDLDNNFLVNNMDKRESKPCLFNAIDCLKNPYGRNSDI